MSPQHQQQCGGDQTAGDGSPSNSHVYTVLRCLRDRGVPVIAHAGIGYSLPVEWRSNGGSSPVAALSVSNSGSGALHAQTMESDAI